MTVRGQLPYRNTRQDSTTRFLGLPTLVRAASETTNGAFGLIEQWSMPPGFASPYHTHHREDEAFYVLEGEMAFVCGGEWLKAGPGTYVFGPRDVPHGFKVEGNGPASLLLLCTPAGFENFVVELSVPSTDPPTPPDMAKLAAVAAKYQIDIHGPLPEQPEMPGIHSHDGKPESTSASDNETLNACWIQAFNERDWTAEAAFRAPDFQAHMPGASEVLHNDAWVGFMSVFTTAFPDARIAVDNSAAEGDTVFSRWTLTATHLGEFQGVPPTGKAVRVTGIDYSRVAGGKFVEHWAQFDMVGLLRQIGAMPA